MMMIFTDGNGSPRTALNLKFMSKKLVQTIQVNPNWETSWKSNNYGEHQLNPQANQAWNQTPTQKANWSWTTIEKLNRRSNYGIMWEAWGLGISPIPLELPVKFHRKIEICTHTHTHARICIYLNIRVLSINLFFPPTTNCLEML